VGHYLSVVTYILGFGRRRVGKYADSEPNWLKTNKGENWFAYFRLYAPTEKYFDRAWPINDIQKVK
jgi:hypothetical protein